MSAEDTNGEDDDAAPAKFNKPTTPERAKRAAKVVADKAAAGGNPVGQKISRQMAREQRKDRK